MVPTEKTPGEKIEEILEEKDWSQNRLAREAGLRPSTVNSVINGTDPQVSTIKNIADALNMGPEEII